MAFIELFKEAEKIETKLSKIPTLELNDEETLNHIDKEVKRITYDISKLTGQMRFFEMKRSEIEKDITVDHIKAERFNKEYEKELRHWVESTKKIRSSKNISSNNDFEMHEGITLPKNLIQIVELKIGITKKEINKYTKANTEIDEIDLKIMRINRDIAHLNKEVNHLEKSRKKYKGKISKEQKKANTLIKKITKTYTAILDVIKNSKNN
ncbi:hypothetical protein KY321_05080 [Candidatus Woesearchaeota archaeon]|nr:hypothetical protein [Candidatus Woesearchaeota archaeon]